MTLRQQVDSLKKVIIDLLRSLDQPTLAGDTLSPERCAELQSAVEAIPAPTPGIPGIEHRLGEIMRHCGDPGTCRGCGAPIKWFVHRMTGKTTPYDTLPDSIGTNHFITCPKRKDFSTR